MASLIGKIHNRKIIVKAWISIPTLPDFNNKDWRSFNALVDTGATNSSVSINVLKDVASAACENRKQNSISVPYTPRSISSATQEEFKTIIVDLNIALGILQQTTFRKTLATTTNWIYHTYPMPVIQAGDEFDLILGMDVLQHCHLSICKDTFILSN